MAIINSTPLVNIIILNYNSWEDTIECIESVLNSTYKNFQIFLVDNNSPNNSEESLIQYLNKKLINSKLSNNRNQTFEYQYIEGFENFKNLFKEKHEIPKLKNTTENGPLKYPIVFLQTKKNLGFAGANNIILNEIQKQNNYVWLLNPDMIIEEQTLENIVNDAVLEMNSTIWGSVIKNYHGNREIISFGGSSINKYLATIKKYKTISDKKIDYIKGNSLFTHLSNFELNGLLPEEYFLYWEETDWCFRAKSQGARLKTCMDAVVYDKGGTSIRRGYLAEYYYTRNSLIFVKKHFSIINVFTVTVFGFIRVVYNLFKGQSNRSRGVFMGIIDFYLKKTGVE